MPNNPQAETTRRPNVTREFCTQGGQTMAVRPFLYDDGQINADALRIFAALEYMYFSLKPCVRRMNVLWNRRIRLDEAMRQERRRIGRYGSIEMTRDGQRFYERTHQDYSTFSVANSRTSDTWSSNFYADYSNALQAIPSTGFNWGVMMGCEVPREVRNTVTDGYDRRDLDYVGHAGYYRNLEPILPSVQPG